MSDYLHIATIILCGIVQASLQLSLGAMLLLYQSSLGQHRRKKTRFLGRNFILGSAVITLLFVGALCYFIELTFGGTLSTLGLVITICMLLACALVMWTIYYRKGDTTELWFPQSFTQFIKKKSRKCSDPVEAFSLGLLSTFAEMPLSLAVLIVAANSILSLTPNLQLGAAFAYPLLCVAPLALVKYKIRSGKNIAEVQRWRIKNKSFIRFVSGSSFAILAFFIFAFWVA